MQTSLYKGPIVPPLETVQRDRKFSTKLSSLAQYALRVACSDRGKLEVFLVGIRLDVTKGVMMEIILPNLY